MVTRTRAIETRAPTALVSLVTAEEFRLLPERNTIQELIDGEVVVAPAPRQKHQWATGRLFRLIDDFLTAADLGIVHFAPFDVYLDTYQVYQPDIVVVLWSNAARLDQDGVHGTPDLIVEILSPSNRKQDLVTKAAEYARAGVPEYWIVDPEHDRIEVNRLDGDRFIAEEETDGMARSVVLAGFVVAASGVFTLPRRMTEAMQRGEEG